jgi:hypothetical protein
MSAGFVGGGGRWLLANTADGRKDLYESAWEVGNREAADRRIWRVRYRLLTENSELRSPKLQTVEALSLALEAALSDILEFADEHRLEGFAVYFRDAVRCLSSEDPFAFVHHKDLAPAGILDLSAKRLLAACQAAWVFGGMGSWNDLGFEGAEKTRYERLSDALFGLLNEGICASVNSVVIGGT